MQYTTNYNLKKPELTDNVKVSDLNENADIIDAQLKDQADDLATHLADLASQAENKGASLVGVCDVGNLLTSTNVEGALQELASRPQKDVDNGRYQARYGWDDAVCVNTMILGDTALLPEQKIIAQDMLTSTAYLTCYNAVAIGEKLLAGFFPDTAVSVESIQVFVPVITTNSGNSNFTCVLYDETEGVAVGTKSIYATVGWCTFTFTTPVVINPTHVYQLRFNYDNGNLSIGAAYADYMPNAYQIHTTTPSTWNTITSNINNDIVFRITVNMAYITGTVTKIINPADFRKWGNLKWQQNTPENTTVTCDILNRRLAYSSEIPILGYETYIGTGQYRAGKWTANSTGTTVAVRLKLYHSNIDPTADLNVHIYNSNGAFPGVSIGSVTLSWKDMLISRLKEFEVEITLSENLVSGDTYYVVLTSVSAPNSYGWAAQNASPGNGLASTDGITWTEQGYNVWFDVWDITTLKSGVTSIADLSDIEVTNTNLMIRWTLTRTTPTVTSPTVSAVSVTWEGSTDLAEFDSVKVTHSYAQSIPIGVDTLLRFNTKVLDTNNMWDSADNTKLICRKTGRYLVIAHVTWTSVGELKQVAIKIKKNTDTIPICTVKKHLTGSTDNTQICMGIVDLTVGDYLRLYAYETLGNSAISVNYGEENLSFSMVRVG